MTLPMWRRLIPVAVLLLGLALFLLLDLERYFSFEMLSRHHATLTAWVAGHVALAAPDTFLIGPALSLADLHLGAMIAYFAAAPEGSALLHHHPRLAAWWLHLKRRPSLAATDPGLPNV